MKHPKRNGAGTLAAMVAVGLLSLGTASVRAATVAQVDTALTLAKAFLLSKQKPDGSWEVSDQRDFKQAPFSLVGGQWGGLSALTTYALLAAGEDPQDPRMIKAIKWLKNADIVGAYALGIRCQIWTLIPQTNETRSLASRDAQRLESGFLERGKGTYLYSYLLTKPDDNSVDHSCSQFGVLGMWACAQAGVEIPSSYWKDVEKRWDYDQQPDGGWLYGAKPNSTDHPGSQVDMTAAGIATLFIAQDYVHAMDGIECHGNLKNEHIDKGLAWIASHTKDWISDHAWGSPSYSLPGYTLYAIERIGVASGLKYFGTIDWYEYGADWCVHHQEKNGAWNGTTNIPNTALVMLFLSKGGAPVVMDKVQYDNASGPDKGKPGHWNQRPRDVANFVHWMSRQTERDLNWQITNLDVPESDLHDAPILYIAGNQAVSLTDSELDKLREFVWHGGMILVNSDCGSAGSFNPFMKSIVKMGHDLFPAYEFRQLPKDHPIFTNEQYPASRWKSPVILRGLSNGVRELMILMPSDPAKYWQMNESTGTGRLEAFQAINDVVLYATDKKQLNVKGQSYLVAPDPKIKPTRTLKMVRLKYAGNWNPEPGGWDRLAAIMHNRNRVELEVKTAELGHSMLGGFEVASLTGTTRLTLTTAEQKQLVNYVNHGGTLLVDAAGGSETFATSAKAILGKLFNHGQPLPEPLPPNSKVFKAADSKAEIHYRSFAREMLGGLRSPQLIAIKVKGRDAVYFSREDLSAGLVGEPVDGIIGYTPQSATDIVSGVILTAHGKKR